MTIRDDLISQRNDINRKLAVIDRVGEDTHPIGTIALFASANEKGYYLKVAEESWRYMSSGGVSKQLVQIILDWEESDIGYFEVYKLLPEQTPFYASA